MENKDMQAMPIMRLELLNGYENSPIPVYKVQGGLTKLEHFTAMAMQGIVQEIDFAREPLQKELEGAAGICVMLAQATLKALEDTKE